MSRQHATAKKKTEEVYLHLFIRLTAGVVAGGAARGGAGAAILRVGRALEVESGEGEPDDGSDRRLSSRRNL